MRQIDRLARQQAKKERPIIPVSASETPNSATQTNPHVKYGKLVLIGACVLIYNKEKRDDEVGQ